MTLNFMKGDVKNSLSIGKIHGLMTEMTLTLFPGAAEATANTFAAPDWVRVNLYLVEVLVNMEKAREMESELLEAIKGVTMPLVLADELTHGDPDRTTYLTLGYILDSQGMALRLMAVLHVLGRGKIMHVGNLHSGGGETDGSLPEEIIKDMAGQGFLSLVDVNLEGGQK